MIIKPVHSHKFDTVSNCLVFKVVKVEPVEVREDSKNPKMLDTVQVKVERFVIHSRQGGDLLICL